MLYTTRVKAYTASAPEGINESYISSSILYECPFLNPTLNKDLSIYFLEISSPHRISQLSILCLESKYI